MTPNEVTLQDVYDLIGELRREMAQYRTCSTCDERHKVIDWVLKGTLVGFVVETVGLLFLGARLLISR